MARLTIIGLGLIGGSIGLAVRRAKLGFEVIGHDRSFEEAGQAKKLGAVDRAEWNLPAAVETADIVVVAVPVQAIPDVFRDIAPHLRPGTIVTDTGSTKTNVMAWASEMLPSTVSFIGGHPMAGKEKSGIAAADADLFNGATYCLIAGPEANGNALDQIATLVEAIGARPYSLDPHEHDSFVAAVSHLPFISAAALVNAVSSGPAWRDARRLAAGGFRDTTRVASGDVVMHRDVCLTNRDSILRWLDEYLIALADLRAAIEAGDDQVEALLRQAKEARDAWESEAAGRVPATYDLPGSGEGISRMLFGQRGTRGNRDSRER
ncbi:MAG TPA: prephenate dehydrogenase/arogenate dehydrogenase family protein [Chloroflexota bacterium]|nr:prephenate dehydrogenase/arogenate dehydrogenase family protein [Chloroflexota bacterium]